MNKSPKSVPALINAFGGATKFAKTIGLNGQSTASEMKRARSIRPKYWTKIIEAARREGMAGITLETLARMHTKSWR